MTSQSIVEDQFHISSDFFKDLWPVREVADILQEYCEEIAARKLKAGPKRRATGPRFITYAMLRQVYELIVPLKSTSSQRIVFKILKAAKIEVVSRKCNCELLDDKKLSAWASSCESLMNKGVRPVEFSEILQKYNGLESLRKNRFAGVGKQTGN